MILERLRNLQTIDQPLMAKFGEMEARCMGYSTETAEGQFEATQSVFFYVVAVVGTISKLLETYQYVAATSSSSPSTQSAKKEETQHPLLTSSFQKKIKSYQDQLIVPTLPIRTSDRLGVFALSQIEVWLKPKAPFVPLAVNEFLNDYEISANATATDDDRQDQCMVVLGAGNLTFLSAVDCLHGLFQCNRVVYLKQHPIRSHHEPLLRYIFQPLYDAGYMASEIDTTLQRSKDIVYHSSVGHVHLTGGKAAHDAIVWGRRNPADSGVRPILQAKMTSELGCVTPWIIAPDQAWTKKQLNHQVSHLFNSLYHNASANCNSPKVIVLPKHWPHAKEFVQTLYQKMEQHPLPVAYYPGSRQRWNAFREAYPTLSKVYGDDSKSAIRRRQLLDTAVVLPWLVVDGIDVDLSTLQGRMSAQTEYAFQNEAFAPVVTIAYIEDSRLSTAVEFCNTYLFGSLSCTIVAPDTTTPDFEKAIANLKYGSVVVNAWSAMSYLALTGTWGAYPGEKLDRVQSGIGQVHNNYFIKDIEKTVVRTPIIDPVLHAVPKPPTVIRKELRALANWTLQPGFWTTIDVLSVMVIGHEFSAWVEWCRDSVGAIVHATVGGW